MEKSHFQWTSLRGGESGESPSECAIGGTWVGIASVRYVETLLYGVKGSDPVMLTGPALVLLAIALLSALPVMVRASRIDPKIMFASRMTECANLWNRSLAMNR